MNKNCHEFIDYILTEAPKHDKKTVENDASSRFNLTKDRTVYHNQYLAVRFCYSKKSSATFSNTVLSLSALEKYDTIPFFVVLVRRDGDNIMLLANTTFLKKISHSSHELTMTNIKGSFNGSDIIKIYEDISNCPENFDALFAIHQALDWEDNLSRLVEATNNIIPLHEKFIPNQAQHDCIIKSIDRAQKFISSKYFSELEADLNQRCNECRNEILIASHIENNNIRGRLIESLITCDDIEKQKIIDNLNNLEAALPTYSTRNGLGDYYKEFNNCNTFTDIKTKVIYLNSNPKAYNIDKFLRQMSESRSVFLFFFIGIDKDSIFNTLLCSVYHDKLIDNTICQFHWAGRHTRGVAQFNGEVINEMLTGPDFQNRIDKAHATQFLTKLINR